MARRIAAPQGFERIRRARSKQTCVGSPTRRLGYLALGAKTPPPPTGWSADFSSVPQNATTE
jgi:hypothetical protein